MQLRNWCLHYLSLFADSSYVCVSTFWAFNSKRDWIVGQLSKVIQDNISTSICHPPSILKWWFFSPFVELSLVSISIERRSPIPPRTWDDAIQRPLTRFHHTTTIPLFFTTTLPHHKTSKIKSPWTGMAPGKLPSLWNCFYMSSLLSEYLKKRSPTEPLQSLEFWRDTLSTSIRSPQTWKSAQTGG